MIKHEEARRKPIYYDTTQKLIDSDFYYDYIAEQEKKDELLGLYRNHHYHLMQGNIAPMLRIRDKIIALEEELK